LSNHETAHQSALATFRLNPSSTATLTGYAYETIPNKSIIAGKTHGKNAATLGHSQKALPA
jgi:hypothetical protein